MDYSSPSPSSSCSSQQGEILQFALFQSLVDAGFWRRLSSLKRDTLRIDQSPINITGFYAPCSNTEVSNRLTLLAELLPSDPKEQSSTELETSHGNRNRCPVPGILYNTNTLESFRSLDKKSLLTMEAKKIMEDITSGKAEEDGAELSRFLLISFADLKKWNFRYCYYLLL